MAIKAKVRWCLVFVAALIGVGQANAALLYHVSISGIPPGVPPGVDAVMFFDLTNGDPTIDHSVTISNFVSDGTLVAPPSLDPSGPGVSGFFSGTLPGSVSISDSGTAPTVPFIVTYSQGINNLGATITFDFQIFGDMSPADPQTADGFVFSLFGLGDDPPLIPLLSEDGVLFLYSIGDPENPFKFVAETVTVEAEEVSVPEPDAPALLLAGLLALGLARLARNSPARKMLAA